MIPLLEVEDLVIRAGTRTLVRGLTLSVNAGEVWAVLGSNGAGKSMFLHALVGLRAPAAGEVRYSGKPDYQWSALDLARMRAFLPQTLHHAFSASVLDVVMLGRHPYMSRWAWEGDREKKMALAALAAVDLADLASRDVMTLSGGERQRVAIAALLVQDAPLLLLDEPVAHLDLQHQIGLLGHLAALAVARERAVIFSVHDLNLAARFATHAMLYRRDGSVHHGPVALVMSDEALSSAFSHPVMQVRVGERSVYVPA